MKPAIKLPNNRRPIWLAENALSAHNPPAQTAATAKSTKTDITDGCSVLAHHVKLLESAQYQVRHTFTVEPIRSLDIVLKRIADCYHRSVHLAPQAWVLEQGPIEEVCLRCKSDKKPGKKWTTSFTPIASLTHH